MPVASPARYGTVASQSQRVMATRTDRGEDATHAIRRRLAQVVVAPARYGTVAPERQRVKFTRTDRDEVATHPAGRRLAPVVVAPARYGTVASQRQRVIVTSVDDLGNAPGEARTLLLQAHASLAHPWHDCEP